MSHSVFYSHSFAYEKTEALRGWEMVELGTGPTVTGLRKVSVPGVLLGEGVWKDRPCTDGRRGESLLWATAWHHSATCVAFRGHVAAFCLFTCSQAWKGFYLYPLSLLSPPPRYR